MKTHQDSKIEPLARGPNDRALRGRLIVVDIKSGNPDQCIRINVLTAPHTSIRRVLKKVNDSMRLEGLPELCIEQVFFPRKPGKPFGVVKIELDGLTSNFWKFSNDVFSWDDTYAVFRVGTSFQKVENIVEKLGIIDPNILKCVGVT